MDVVVQQPENPNLLTRDEDQQKKVDDDFARGMAKVKAEYLLMNYVRQLDTSYLSTEDKQKLLQEGKKTAATDPTAAESKKPKLKGRNKRRAGNVFRGGLKMCSFFVRQAPCPFGDKCRYSHNIEEFLNQKEPDIGNECPNYAKNGSCPFGFTCRFAGAHPVSTETPAPEGGSVRGRVSDESNGMSRQLQTLLRKRKFEFCDGEDNEKPLETGLTESTASEDIIAVERRVGSVTNEGEICLRPAEKKPLDFRGKLYLSPLTTVGNLPYRRICKRLGADITCGEMALAGNLLSGQQSEWALMLRHQSEDIFGVQVCGSKPDMMGKLAYLLKSEVSVDFVDINSGCPIDLVCNSGSGCAMMGRLPRMEGVVRSMSSVLDVPLTVKMRTGIYDNKNIAHELIPKVYDWGASMIALHGRSRDQRYTRLADWDYIARCAEIASPKPLFGNGDCMNFEDYYDHVENTKIAGILIARGALIKPWIFTEIKERRHWDISANERLDIFKDYVRFGLEHWGSDNKGVENTRRFLLEWMSFTHRYIPVGILETVPQRINERPPYYQGRSDLESMMGSAHCRDWIKLSEMLLGPVPDGFTFLPKHKANAWK